MVDKPNFVNIKIKSSDFDKEDCQRILNKSSADRYDVMHGVFFKARQKLIAEKKLKQAKIYWLLSKACYIVLSPDNKEEPFGTPGKYLDRQFNIADFFSKEDFTFFSEIVTEVTNIRLKARLADFAWLKVTKDKFKNALVAIDSYRQVPLNEEAWVRRNGCACWHRAVSLAVRLQNGAGNRIQEMESEIYQVLSASNESDCYFVLALSDLMYKFDLGKGNAVNIVAKLEALARQFENSGDFFKAINCYNSSLKWSEFTEDTTKSVKMTVCHAESYVKDAMTRTTAEGPNNMITVVLYEKAIQILRTIPKTKRPAFRVDERIAELHKLLNKAGQLSLSEMGVVASTRRDITPLVEDAKSAVSNKSPTDALMAFANISQDMQISKMRESAIEQLSQYPFSSLLSGTHLSRDGRVIAKTNRIDFDEGLTDDRSNVQEYIMQNHHSHLTLVVQGYILPALGILHLEHRIHEVDFLSIVKQSPIIPLGREIFFAKGLFAGYDHDYATALHLLVPQIEHLVRYHLKNAGAKTSNLDSLGIETENGLNTLVDLPEMKDVFGNNLTFEIKALFCDPLGANFRNELAHGLVEYSVCNSFHGVYAWWFILKLIFNTFWNATRQEPVEKENGP